MSPCVTSSISSSNDLMVSGTDLIEYTDDRGGSKRTSFPLNTRDTPTNGGMVPPCRGTVHHVHVLVTRVIVDCVISYSIHVVTCTVCTCTVCTCTCVITMYMYM